MKTIRGAAIAVSTLILTSFPASAQQGSMGANEAYCATMKSDQNAGKLDCKYKTMAACEAAVKDNQGTCTQNTKK